MKKILILAFLLLSLGTYAQREVPQSRMEPILKYPFAQPVLPVLILCLIVNLLAVPVL